MARGRRRVAASRAAGSRAVATKARQRSAWRANVDSFGGFAVIVPLVLAIVVVGAIVVRTPLGFTTSDDPLLGDAVSSGPASHVADGSLSADALPPTGGPHSSVPQRVASYDSPIEDGNAIHALEHGVVWISYQPDLLTADDIEALERVRSDFSRDVILSPRPANSDAVVAASWERRLILDDVDSELLREFVATNRNRSPEPGIR